MGFRLRIAPADRARLAERILARAEGTGVAGLKLVGLREPADALLVGFGFPYAELQAYAAHVTWVHTLTAGVDPLVSIADRTITNSSGTMSRPVAEFALARILEWAKGLPGFAANQERQHWQSRFLRELPTITLGVWGYGAIGRELERFATALGLQVRVCRKRPGAGQYGANQLAEMTARCDVLVAAVAATAETRGAVSTDVLAALPDGGLFVNVARADVVDEPALLAEVRSGRLVAALDVFSPEPLPAGHPLWTAPGVRISPHSSGLTEQRLELGVDLLLDNCRRYAAGEPLVNVVDMTAGYLVLPD